MTDQTVRRSTDLDTDVDTTWRLLSDPDLLRGWLGDLDGSLLTPGGAASLVEPDGTRRRLVVDEVAPGRSIGFTWWADEGDGAASTVTITVGAAEGGGSRVEVTERPAPAGARACSLSDAAGAWDERLTGLELGSLLLGRALAGVVA